MAITRSQQAKQMLQNGGMLVQPSMTGKRPGYRGDAAARSTGAAQSGRADPGTRGDPGEGADKGGNFAPTRGEPAFTSPDRFVKITDDQINQAKDFKELQKFKLNLTKPNFTPGFAAKLLTKVFPGNIKYKQDFLKNNPQLLEYFNSLTEEEQKSNATMVALADILNIDGKTYEDFLAFDKGAPGLKYKGNVGGLEKFAVKDVDGNVIGYDYRDKPDDNDAYIFPRSGIMAEASSDMDQESEIDEDEGANFRLLADGGRAGFRVGGASGREYDKAGTATTTAKAPPSMGFGNPPPGSTGEGGGNNEPPIQLPKPLKRTVDTIGEGMFLKNLINLNPMGIMKNIGSKILLDKLISEADTQENNNMLFADALTTPTEGKLGLNLIDYSKLKNTGYSDAQIQELQSNPKIDVKEVIRDIEGPIFAAADGGRAGLAGGGMPYEGGIMDLESGRQMYFLGKLVKKATRAVKKIVKSPIGKAALLAAPFAFPAARSGLASFLFKNPMAKGSGFGGFMEMLKGGMTGGGKFALGAGLTLAPFLMGDQEEEQKPLYAGADLPYPIDYYLSGQYGMNRRLVADGGIMRANYQEGGDAEPVAKKTMPLLDMDGQEKDYRETGGFVDMGRMERADDVPARLSKNEFVFTADAVRNAGEGDIDKGAEVMYNMMKNLEAGGEVSEESQGLEGAREMFQTSQRLEEVL